MSPRTLPPVTKEILDECPQFRVLVVGKSGAGKSSLINYAFGIDKNDFAQSVSHEQPGQCDIEKPITFAQNPRFVLHDSMGFEPGDEENLERAKQFLESRTGDDVDLKERVHVIWLCIQVPYADSRVFETGDEDFLKLAFSTKVPVVVVFTQFDRLIYSIYLDLTDEEKSAPDILLSCAKEAETKFQKLCVAALQRLKPTPPYARSSGLAGKVNSKPDRQALDALVKLTRDLVERYVEGEVWIVSAMAQRASTRVTIATSIEVGMSRYWRGLASSANFSQFRLDKCLTTVHEEIVDIWNFYDPHELLVGQTFSDQIKSLVQRVTQDTAEEKSGPNLEDIQTLIGVGLGATVAAAAGPVIAGITLTGWFVQRMASVYDNTPETLRCFMAYIVDLTLVLDQLFLVVLSIRPARPLTNADISMAFENYGSSNRGAVHREIREYVRQATVTQILHPTTAEEKVKELILKYCVDHNTK
ncbi:hypothetical protein B0H14DRAFT_2953336 [Mycena olivaceomarginata]|nr:hypothetical protein B0H14DRAFT_2953336 [Mycena olivaceomarginata]